MYVDYIILVHYRNYRKLYYDSLHFIISPVKSVVQKACANIIHKLPEMTPGCGFVYTSWLRMF